jgi:hypothetical protein
MYLYPLIPETWQEQLKVIAVFLGVEDQYLRIGKGVPFTQGADTYLLKLNFLAFFRTLQSCSDCCHLLI